MTTVYQDWPAWVLIACGVIVAGIVLWILAKALKWLLWLVLIGVLAACVVAALHQL